MSDSGAPPSDTTTVITGGRIVSERGVLEADVEIRGQRILAVRMPGEPSTRADERIDASGQLIAPGVIDPHVHFEDPGHTEREDFTTGTMAAAAGGVTTVFEHPLTYPAVTTGSLFASKRELASAKAVVDFGLWGGLTPDSLPHLAEQAAEGARGFKAFMPQSDPDYPAVDDAQLLEGMRTAAALDALVLVHAENAQMLAANLARVKHEGRGDYSSHSDSRPPIVEAEAIQRAITLAEAAGSRLQVVHVSTPQGADHVADAKRRGQLVTMEVCPHHLLLDAEDGNRLGPYGYCAPPLRDRELVEGLWRRVQHGVADCFVSDHAPYTVEEKEAGHGNIFDAPLGLQVLQESFPLLLDEGMRRGVSLEGLVAMFSGNAARILGLYPDKGVIQAGSLADLVLFELDSPWVVHAARQQLSKNPWSPFEGRACQVRVRRTLVRGRTVFVDGEVVVEPGWGRFLGHGATREWDATYPKLGAIA